MLTVCPSNVVVQKQGTADVSTQIMSRTEKVLISKLKIEHSKVIKGTI